jgi:hypothetical protein
MIQIPVKCPSCGAAHNPVSHCSLSSELRFPAGDVGSDDAGNSTGITYLCDTCGEAYCVENVAEAP